MKIRYTAHSPADSEETLAKGELTLPDDAGDMAIIGALVNAVEQKALTDPGSQMRVIAWRNDEADPYVWHSWDHE